MPRPHLLWPLLVALALCVATQVPAQPRDGAPAGAGPAGDVTAADSPGSEDALPAPDAPLTESPAADSGPSLIAPDPATPERSAAPDRSTLAPAPHDARPTRACTARVIGLRPLSHYDHAQGSGFLAVREGPGSTFPQTGELYLGDRVTIGDRRGNWYAVRCTSGLCMAPLWGQTAPQGWAYGRFLHLSCPD